METRAEQIFSEALGLAPEAREVFLAGACAGDPELRATVEEMLRASILADSFFAEIPTAHVAPLFAEKEGDVIGPYTLRQKLGEGGFGEVWMAEQTSPMSRMVALKVIKAGMDTREFLARFETERQALALMDHPNIAKVLDAGATATGRPFFAMELVKGISLTRFCDEAELGTDARLALFIDVCSAIGHAHQKGVIHRDIKPSNVLVTLHGERPVVKVIDFGIAKAVAGRLTNLTLFTRFEQFLGTPAYMSPEQASLSGLDIDTRADIYGLGVLLYELLAGKPPFDSEIIDSAGYDEMRRIIREVEPVRPSTKLKSTSAEERRVIARSRNVAVNRIGALIESDLDWIVLKAIEKDRSLRYATADELAKDVLRFLANEPVSATPPSPGYILRKFAKRHRSALRIGLAGALLLIAATTVSTWLAIRARSAEALAAEKLVEASAERDAKELALRESEAVARFLEDVFRSPDPYRDGRSVTVAEALDRAVERMDANLAGQPARHAKLLSILAVTYQNLGLYRRVAEIRQKVLDISRATKGDEHPESLEAMRALALSYQKLGLYQEAAALGGELVRIRERLSGEERIDSEKGIASLKAAADAYRRSGRKSEAIAMRERILEIRAELSGAGHPETLREVAELASNYSSVGRHQDALALRRSFLDRALAIPDANLGSILALQIELLQSEGRSSEAQMKQEQMLALLETELAKHDAQSSEDSAKRLETMRQLAFTYLAVERGADARAMFLKILQLLQENPDEQRPGIANALRDLAYANSRIGRNDEAIRNQEEAVALCKQVFGIDHEETITTMEALAEFYAKLAGRFKDTWEIHKEILAIREKTFGPLHLETLGAMHRVAMTSYYERDYDLALSLMETYATRMAKVDGPDAGHQAAPVLLYLVTGRTSEGLKLLNESRHKSSGDTFANLTLACLQLWFDDKNAYQETRRRMMAWILARADRINRVDIFLRVARLSCLAAFSDPSMKDKARFMVRRAGELRMTEGSVLGAVRQRVVDPHPKAVINSPYHQLTLGMVQYRCGDFAEAEATLRHTRQIAEEFANVRDRPYIVWTASFYQAMAMFQQGQKSAARDLCLKTAERIKHLPESPEGLYHMRPLQDPAHPLYHNTDPNRDDMILWLACREAVDMIAPESRTPVPQWLPRIVTLNREIKPFYHPSTTLQPGEKTELVWVDALNGRIRVRRLPEANDPVIYAIPSDTVREMITQK